MTIKKISVVVGLAVVGVLCIDATDSSRSKKYVLERAAQKLLNEHEQPLVLTYAERDALLEVVDKEFDDGPEKRDLIAAIERAACGDSKRVDTDDQAAHQDME